MELRRHTYLPESRAQFQQVDTPTTVCCLDQQQHQSKSCTATSLRCVQDSLTRLQPAPALRATTARHAYASAPLEVMHHASLSKSKTVHHIRNQLVTAVATLRGPDWLGALTATSLDMYF